MTVITVSGQPGTRARDIGRLIAVRLEIDYIDQEILVQAAGSLGVPMETVVPFEERTAGLGERLATMLRRFLGRAADAGDRVMGTGGLDVVLGQTYAEAAAEASQRDVSQEQYVATLTGIVKDLAKHGNVLIIGRGSQVILKDWPGVMHVLLVAPREHQIQTLMEREGLSREEAAKRTHDSAKGRANFHQAFFSVHVDDPALYHVTLNTAQFAPEQAAEIVAGVWQLLQAKRPG